MLAMARGLMADPKLLMLDEPSMGLAPVVVEIIFETIQKLNEAGITILLVEQNAAMALADRRPRLRARDRPLTGCGGGSGAKSDTGKGTVVKLGIGAPLTAGSVAQGLGIQRGVELAVKQANERDDVKAAGIKFATVPGDDQGDPKTGVTVANTFASDRALVGVVGHLNSGVTIPASKVYNDAKIAMVSPAATNPALTLQKLNNVFRVCTIDSVQGPMAADAAFDKFGAKTVVVIDDSTPYGEGLASEFGKQFVAKGGKSSSPSGPRTRTPTSTPWSPRSRLPTPTSSTTAAFTTPVRC